MPHKRSSKPVRHKSLDDGTADIVEQNKNSAKTCNDSTHICDKSSSAVTVTVVTKEQNSLDSHDTEISDLRSSRSNVKDTHEQKQRTETKESKGPLHGMSFKSKSSLARTDYPSKGELSLRSSFNSKKQNSSAVGLDIPEPRSRDVTPNSSPKLTQPLKFTPSSLEHTSAKRFSSYDSTKFKVPSAENSDEDEIMV